MTTILAVKKDDQVAIAGDGQVTLGEKVIMKHSAKKGYAPYIMAKWLLALPVLCQTPSACLKNLKIIWSPVGEI